MIRLILALALLATPAAAMPARMIDGDTLDLGGQHWRLCGIDAAEVSTRAGRRAREYMHELVDGRDVQCQVACNRRSYDRLVGYCEVDGQDLGRLMLNANQACRWSRFDPDGRYDGAKECSR